MDNSVNFDKLKQQFGRMGARLEVSKVSARSGRSWRGQPQWSPVQPFSANIRTDEKGEHFTMRIGDNTEIPADQIRTPGLDLSKIQVLDVQPKDRHLVLQVILGEGRDVQVDKFLMGHDERHWFMARVNDNVTTVQQAKEALKPAEVSERVKRVKVKRSKRNKRRNKAFVRQGEWFFMPEPDFYPGKQSIVARNEPLVRGGGGKPHIAEECCRVGGTTVMVNRRFAPNGISMAEYNKLRNERHDDPEFRRSGAWNAMTRDASVYVRGAIRHPDHKTLKLKKWYRVVPNTEQRRVAGRVTTMAFLD
jgi:hypothetical protein